MRPRHDFKLNQTVRVVAVATLARSHRAWLITPGVYRGKTGHIVRVRNPGMVLVSLDDFNTPVEIHPHMLVLDPPDQSR